MRLFRTCLAFSFLILASLLPAVTDYVVLASPALAGSGEAWETTCLCLMLTLLAACFVAVPPPPKQ